MIWGLTISYKDNMDNEYELRIDEDYKQSFTEREAKDVLPILNRFIDELEKRRSESPKVWMPELMKSILPDTPIDELQGWADEIDRTVGIHNEKKKALDEAVKSGKNRDSWFAGEVMRAASNMTAQESMEYMRSLDNALADANSKMYQTILTKSGLVSQNPNLDGYIAEQHHAQTFNLNAAARGSKFRARVVEPDGTYNKNGVDIVVEDTTTGKVVSRYQSKYCKDPSSTEAAFENGDYRGQQKLTPSDQEIGKKSTDVIKAPDGTTSDPLTKADAGKMRDEAQSGKWNELNWNEYKAKDLAIGIGKQAGKAGIIGAAFGAGTEIARKVINGEEVDGREVAKSAIKGGADAGVKTVVAGALKVGVEKGVIKALPKGTPLGAYSTIACVAVENAKIAANVAAGKLSVPEALSQSADVTVSGVAGAIGSAVGKKAVTAIISKIGATIGTAFGPVGTAIGGFVGSVVGYAAGSAIGKAVVAGAKKIIGGAAAAVKGFCTGVKNAFTAVKNFVFG